LNVLVKIFGAFTFLKEKKAILKISTAKRTFYSTKLQLATKPLKSNEARTKGIMVIVKTSTAKQIFQ